MKIIDVCIYAFPLGFLNIFITRVTTLCLIVPGINIQEIKSAGLLYNVIKCDENKEIVRFKKIPFYIVLSVTESLFEV